MFKIRTILVFYSLGLHGNGMVSYFTSTIASKGAKLLIPTTIKLGMGSSQEARSRRLLGPDDSK
jgi:hypothetical protein